MERSFLYQYRVFSKIILISILVVLPLLSFPKFSAKAASEPNEMTISTFESGKENWKGDGSLETDHVKQGKTSLKLTSNGFNWNMNDAANVDLDLSLLTKSNYEMAIFVYVEDPSKISGIRLDLGNDSSSFYFKNMQTSGYYQKGWNEIRFKGEEFKSQYPPVDWSKIKFIRINLAASGNDTTVSAWFDDWKITNAPKAVITPNVKGASTFRDISKQLNISGHMSINVIWSIIILIFIGLGVWLILKFLKKRKTSQIESPSIVERSKASFNIFHKNINPKILLIFGVLIVVLSAVFVWYYLASKSPSKKTSFAVPSIKAEVQSATISNPQTVTTKWQYKVSTYVLPEDLDKIETELNALGAEGWELVSQSVSSTGKTGGYNQTYTLKKILP